MITSRRDKYAIVSGFDKSLTSEEERILRDMLFMIRKNGFYYTWLFFIRNTRDDKKNIKEDYKTIITFIINEIIKNFPEFTDCKKMIEYVEIIRNLSTENPYIYACISKEVYQYVEVILEVKKLSVYRDDEIMSLSIFEEIQEYINNRNTSNHKMIPEPIFNKNYVEVKNIGLLIDKYYGFEKYIRIISNSKSFDKTMFLKEKYQEFSPSSELLNELKEIKERQSELISYLHDNKYTCIEAYTINKIVISMGDTDTKENSIKINHIYGFPYITASTIKGAFRAYLENNLFEVPIIELFGDNEKKGNLIFYDAYPETFEIGVDIVNCHFSDYYTQNKLPTDSRKLSPVKFYAVKNALFSFYIGFNTEEEKALIEKMFIAFIEDISMGAKKSIGYGNFKIKKVKGDMQNDKSKNVD